MNARSNWTEVQGSSNIAAIQYTSEDPLADFGILRIRFIAGGEYSYAKVPNQLAVDFFESESKGRFFHANILNSFSAEKHATVKDEQGDQLREELDD